MQTDQIVKSWFTAEYDYVQPRRGQILKGVILQRDGGELIVDVGLKRDGLVPERDLRYLDEEDLARLEPGNEITTRVVYPRDREGRLLLSVYQARFQRDWEQASTYLESGDLWEGQVTGHNKGGLTVAFGSLQGFVPLSHLSQPGLRRLPPDEYQARLQDYVGQPLPLKVITVDPPIRRLVMSERLGRRLHQKQVLRRLLDELSEGQIVRGKVTNLCTFGAFVDIGGAEGLIHVSEMAYNSVEHPEDVVHEGEEIDVYVLRLDRARQRISLSLKRLLPDPWDTAQEMYTEGQLVKGTVTRLAEFGAFVTLEGGITGLAHVSELADPPPVNPDAIVQLGEERLFQILQIDPERRRMGLSLKQAACSPRVEASPGQEPATSEESPPVEESARNTIEEETGVSDAPDVLHGEE